MSSRCFLFLSLKYCNNIYAIMPDIREPVEIPCSGIHLSLLEHEVIL